MLKKEKNQKNLMVILSSPSGAGKTTLSKKIQQKFSNFKISISHTTRKPRPNEVESLDYFFIDESDFLKKIKNNEFYEYAKIFDNYYGTSKKSVNNLKEKFNILFDIDWQGTKQLSKYKELDLIKIFILPPSKNELEKRLIERNKGDIKAVNSRLSSYDSDRKFWNEYDYVLINDNLENCFNQIEKIIDNRFNFSI